MVLPVGLLALAVGASAGAAELKDQERAAAAKLAEEKAKGEAEAVKAERKARAEILARAEADILKKREEEQQRRKTYTSFLDLYSTGAPGSVVSQATGYSGWDDSALATFRVPMFNEDGDQMISPETTRPLFRPVQVKDSSQTGVAGATAEFQKLTGSEGLGKRELDWLRNNNVDEYEGFTSLLSTTVRVMAGGTSTPSITGQTASVPVVLPSTVKYLSQKYGPDYAYQIVNDALVGTGQVGIDPATGRDRVKQAYAEQFGSFPATNAKTKVTPVQTAEGTAFTVTYPEGGGWIEGFDREDGTLFEEGRVRLKQAAEAIDVSMPKMEQLIHAEAERLSTKLDREVKPGEVAYDIYMIRESLSGYGLYNQRGAGAFFSVKTQANAYDRQTIEDFIAKYGLFSPNSDYDADLALFQAIAPIGAKSYYPRMDGKDNRSLLEGGAVAGSQLESKEFYAQPSEEYDTYINKKYGRVLGEDLQSFRNKGLAAGDAMLTLDALMYLGTQQEITIPIGLARNAVMWTASAVDQIDSITEVLDDLNLSEDNKKFVAEKLAKTKQSLSGTDMQGKRLQDVANAIAQREFYEGVLVYSMAMALQGGNAAARTISDADITRIREILSLSTGATREQRMTIYTALRKMMARQKAISDAAVGGGEAGVWAAATMSQFQDRAAVMRQEIDSVLKLARRVTGKRVPDGGTQPQGFAPGDAVPGLPGFIYDQNGNAIPA